LVDLELHFVSFSDVDHDDDDEDDDNSLPV